MALTKKTETKAPPPPGPGHSTDQKRQQVGLLLRNADKFIKESKLDLARGELQKVRELDPTNPYALAFEERIVAIEKEKAKPAEQPKPQLADAQPAKEAEKPAVAQVAPEKLAPPPAIEKPTAKEALPAEVAPPPAIDEKKLAEERSRLEEEFRKQQASRQEQAEKAFDIRLKEELQKAEVRFREQLEAERLQSEEDGRKHAEADAAAKIKELQASIDRERTSLAEKERQSIEVVKKEMEADFAKRMTSELDKFKKSSTSEERELRTKLEESLRGQMQKESEMRIAQERSTLEEANRRREKEIEQSFKERHDLFVKEVEQATDKKVKEIKERESEKFEQKKAEIQKTLSLEFESKLQKALTEEQRKFDEQIKKRIDEEQASLEKERTRFTADVAKVSIAAKAEAEKQFSKTIEAARQEVAQSYERRLQLLGVGIPKTKDDKMKLYYDRIREAWASGPLTMEKAQSLMELQELLNISFEDHADCESNVRLQLYADAVEQAILGGKIKATDAQALDELKHRYDITVEEAANLEPLILSAFQRSATKATILVSDDDAELSTLIKGRLEEQGYKVVVQNSVMKSFDMIQTTPVDLILSDLRYQGEKMDGFTFFKEIQKDPKLRRIPFVLMTSMDEGLFMRTGVQLGIDDYLTKPLDLELLVAVVEGKLKKYRSLREN